MRTGVLARTRAALPQSLVIPGRFSHRPTTVCQTPSATLNGNRQTIDFETLEVGYDIPARPGQRIDEVLTPALIARGRALRSYLQPA